GIPTPISHILDTRDDVCPLPFPVIVKPIHEGSTVGLHVVRNQSDWTAALEQIRRSQRPTDALRVYMIEPMITGPNAGRARQLTAALPDTKPLPIIGTPPASGLYDYEAKYHRDDTVYTLDPGLPPGVADTVKRHAEILAERIGTRHVARADFML